MTTIETIEKIDDSVIDIYYARELLKELGEDVSCIEDSWCYPQLIEHYGDNEELIDKIKQYFNQYPNVIIAYELYRYNVVDLEWAEKIIEKNNDSYRAYRMVLDYESDREWAEEIIEKNNDSYSAYWMVVNCGSKKEWYEKIKESQ